MKTIYTTLPDGIKELVVTINGIIYIIKGE